MRSPFLVASLLVGCPGSESPTDGGEPLPPVTVRVVTWNIQSIGSQSSTEGAAEREVLARIDADVVALNEVTPEQTTRLRQLGEDLGYDTIFMPEDNPFGSLRNALLCRLPCQVEAVAPASTSGDDRANDVTRYPVRAVVDVPDTEVDLTVVVNHWKSGFDNTDQFRRTLDGIRTAQAAATASGPFLVVGDVNAELEDMPESPPVWTYAPTGLPSAFRLGSDQQDALEQGIPNDAFAPMQALGMGVIEATQVDGRTDTRPQSGRRIDWVLASEDLAGAVRGEVYDSTDEGQGSGLPKPGAVPSRAASEQASDHLPVFVDVDVPR